MNNSEIEKSSADTERGGWIDRYSLFIGKIGGVPVSIHFSFALVFTLITWTLSYNFFPVYYPGLPLSAYIGLGFAGATIALFSILFHELGHSTIANKYGTKFEKIVLFAFGGIALNSREICDPKKEIRMAFAGPWISFIISGFSFSLWLIVFESHIISPAGSPIAGILFYAGLINLAIGLFNLLPIFPTDGGRILRAFLSMHLHDHIRGTKAAIRIGMIISLCLVLAGVIIGLTLSFVSGLWLMILAFFLMRGSKWYYRHYQAITSRA
jgi:Zn-dependent protease